MPHHMGLGMPVQEQQRRTAAGMPHAQAHISQIDHRQSKSFEEHGRHYKASLRNPFYFTSLSTRIVKTPPAAGEFFSSSTYDGTGEIRLLCRSSVRARRSNMDRMPAYSIFAGLLIGAVLGAGTGVLFGDAMHGMQLGALAGVFIGWVITSLTFQNK
jgi:hypothetical protein